MHGSRVRSRSARRIVSLALAAGVIVAGGLVGSAHIGDEPVPCPPKPALEGMSVARRWDEQLLAAIRRALPNPPVHARNLFHLSVAMWDAWAAYDTTAAGYVFKEKLLVCDVAAARNEAISYAAYDVLSARFAKSIGAEVSLPEFAKLMDDLGYTGHLGPTQQVPVALTEGDLPSAVGHRVAAAVLRYGLTDGSNEANGYVPTDYKPVNQPMIVALPGVRLVDPNRWQPLQVDYLVSQNGIPVPGQEQKAVGVHWGHVTPFAIPAGGASGVPIDPGAQPRLSDATSDAAFKQQVVEVIRDSSVLDAKSGTVIDVSPGALGANSLGANDGHGYAKNPVTGAPYERNMTAAGDFYRALAEFWADGPNSETPPGHWNVIANAVSDALAPDLRLAGSGRAVPRLEWDVKLYLALNGAVHDAAIAAWGVKGRYDGVRPISMVRYMAGLGQSSDPSLPSYDREGLPLVPGLIEVITRAKTAAGAAMESLRGHEGEIAIRAWRRIAPEDPSPHVAWILGTAWVPYQLPTFVTPAFPGYISGHSTFSRAAAEVLAAITGSPYFPGGLSSWTVAKDTFRIEPGPSADVILSWASYYDAADQAGQSRLFGGIHVQADDFSGRITGSLCGKDAWQLAQRYYAGRIK